MPEPSDHAENRNFVETILRHVPGFRGYLEKEYRRDSDALQRKYLADRLQRAKQGLDDLGRTLVDAGQIDLLPQIDRVRSRLEKLIWRIRSAMQGYSGLFDLVRIDEHLLDHVYQHDMDLMQAVDTLGKAIEQLAGQKDQVATALPDVLRQIDELGRQWDAREDLLRGLESPEPGGLGGTP
jgi:phage shock protein A